MQNFNISIIGAGNIATHLAINFTKKGHLIEQVYSRNINNAKILAKKIKANPINNLANLKTNIDIILICVSDSAIIEVVNQLNFRSPLIAHTAGSVPMQALNKFDSFGVFYPLQTFSKNAKLNLNKVPFCIEANSEVNKKKLIDLANSISNNIFELNSEERLQAHLAAVFANNFSNHMFAMAEQMLKKHKIPFDILKPIILETATKIQQIPPQLAQTGPAVRNDIKTMEKHLALLTSQHLENLYSFVSQSIQNLKNQ